MTCIISPSRHYNDDLLWITLQEILKWLFCFHAHKLQIGLLRRWPNRLDPFIVINKQSFFSYPSFCLIWHQRLRGTLHMVSEHKVTTLGPSGLINMQVWCELCDFFIKYFRAYYERKYCSTLCSDGLRIICNACTKIQKKGYLFKDTIRLVVTTLSKIHLCCLYTYWWVKYQMKSVLASA